MNESKPTAKPFVISKALVWEAWRKVRANHGAAGVDEQSVADFEVDAKRHLYKLWNRMSSGSYFPPPVRTVEIPKRGGTGTRILGVPTVADRIAQTVVAMTLEPNVEPVFHDDSYGGRPGRSAHQALEVTRKRCWKKNWVIDLDVKAFFDSVPHDLVLKAVNRHTDQGWVLLYVKRWLQAPRQHADGTLVVRDRGTPQGSAISPMLSNIFMHYAFDRWMQREFPTVEFERYVDDAVVHCASERQAKTVRNAISQRLAGLGLELHPEKTKVVYCRDSNRRGPNKDYEQFTFLGYTFRPRLAMSKAGDYFVSFSPAISDEAAKEMRRRVKRWRLHLRNNMTLNDLAGEINVVVTGWINFFGKFCRVALRPILQQVNDYLVRWAMRKYKRLSNSWRRARSFVLSVAQREPDLFAHWRSGARPDGWTMGAV